MEFDALAEQLQKAASLQSVYIRSVGNQVIAEKKSFWTDIKNCLNPERKEQYDFQKAFATISRQFPKIAKDDLQYERLNLLAGQLNELLEHVNASRKKKNKPPYTFERLVIQHPATIHPLQDVFPMTQS